MISRYCIQKNYNKFQVTIVRNQVHYYIGTFSTIEEAINKRDKELIKYNSGLELDYKSVKKYNLK